MSESRQWAERFFAEGWRGQPWVVLKREPRTDIDPRKALHDATNTGGWVFNLWRHDVLHAPTYDIFAPQTVQEQIVSAIEHCPAQRAQAFQQYEKPFYEAAGWPSDLVSKVTPRSTDHIRENDFRWPILLVASGEDSRTLVLLGTVTSIDIVLAAFIEDHQLSIDDATSLLVLLTGHGDPREGYAKTPYAAPFHPKGFRIIRTALQQRSADRDPTTLRNELKRLLFSKVPDVVTSLRESPPNKGATVHSVARSRLAEHATEELAPGRRRKELKSETWDAVVQGLLERLPPERQGLLFKRLTLREREMLSAVHDGALSRTY